MFSFDQIVEQLTQNQVVAYPTEAVFGLGCNPNSEHAVHRLLALKQRPIEKGLILVAPSRDFFLPYLDESRLTDLHWQRFEQPQARPISWIMPAKASVPRYLKGQFDTIALRLCRVPAVVQLCQATGFALTSTSANLSGQTPCRTAQAVRSQFGEHFPVLDAETGGEQNPSEIRDIFSQHIFRQG
ncbi:tRNA threonylcarbamoyladenosine biosynthesis protein RimN [[Actinobacillus] muris]|uniref:Threonylcarbamoyl-AMP synthase n=1 Tax=Muribacter muris TaxID=67855 RepID=A0A0J5P661_9PAST|nr:Sua5/YciO/YrdC/YwlC family protein [Muribacter muris]KMK51868.1 tRNA threonylcarbamoyladenosine biosynthesis protein RimN [[Actinobacillus] muris] [Muribacter muris]